MARVSRTSFVRKYSPADVALPTVVEDNRGDRNALAHAGLELAEAHDTLSSPATRVLALRAHVRCGDAHYARLADISVSHLYNLRASTGYSRQRLVWQKTRPSPIKIGVRKAPHRKASPACIRAIAMGPRVSTISMLDIVTQWELTASVEWISEAFLLPVIALLLEGFPFVIRGFHSDSGGEYVNHEVALLLDQLRVEFTKSRLRRTNDNALAESNNGAVICKLMGYSHILRHHATASIASTPNSSIPISISIAPATSPSTTSTPRGHDSEDLSPRSDHDPVGPPAIPRRLLKLSQTRTHHRRPRTSGQRNERQ